MVNIGTRSHFPRAGPDGRPLASLGRALAKALGNTFAMSGMAFFETHQERHSPRDNSFSPVGLHRWLSMAIAPYEPVG